MSINQLEAFMKGLDLHQPNWWQSYANEQELKDFAHDVGQEIVSGRSVERIRRCVAIRLLMPVRAAIDAGLVTANEEKIS